MISWEVVKDTLLVARYAPEGSDDDVKKSSPNKIRVAAFDLDSTLIDSKSGIVPNSDPEDWEWWQNSVPEKIRDAHLGGYQLVIFTNQGNLTTPTGELGPGLESFKRKIKDITNALSVPLIVYTACANDIYRKPRIGMWEEMEKALGGAVDLEDSYFVGDAAGRENDYSDCDRHFSMNLGLRFYTPDEYFQGVIGQILGHRFNPNWSITPDIEVRMNKNLTEVEMFNLSKASHSKYKLTSAGENIIIVLVGLPGAGKTTFFNVALDLGATIRLNRHELGTMENCMEKAEHYLKRGFGVVIDDCNLDISSRATWIDMATRVKVPVLAAEFTTSSDLCLHNDSVRSLGGAKDASERRKIFPRTEFRQLEKQVEAPTIEEGFSDVVKVDFEWVGTRTELDIWRRHWL